MKILNVLYIGSWVALFCGAVGKFAFPSEASYLFLGASLLLAVTQFLGRVKGGSVTLRRLVVQQMLGALAFVVAGILMFTHVRNEWIIAMFIGSLIQLYTAFRIPQELEKGGR